MYCTSTGRQTAVCRYIYLETCPANRGVQLDRCTILQQFPYNYLHLDLSPSQLCLKWRILLLPGLTNNFFHTKNQPVWLIWDSFLYISYLSKSSPQNNLSQLANLNDVRKIGTEKYMYNMMYGEIYVWRRSGRQCLVRSSRFMKVSGPPLAGTGHPAGKLITLQIFCINLTLVFFLCRHLPGKKHV